MPASAIFSGAVAVARTRAPSAVFSGQVNTTRTSAPSAIFTGEVDTLPFPKNAGPSKEAPLDVQSAPPASGASRETPLSVSPQLFSGPSHERDMDAFPSEYSGPARGTDLDTLPPDSNSSGAAQETALIALPPDRNKSGPSREAALSALTGFDPFVEDVTVVQRDLISFLADVSFNAYQIQGAPLTLEVEYQQGGTTGTWLEATEQAFDRQHDPEAGGFIRVPYRQGLQGYYRFDDDFNDSAEYDRHLSFFGPAPSFTDGPLNRAVRFTGTAGQYLTRGADDEAFQLADDEDFTLRLWVRWNDVTGRQTIVEKSDLPSGPGWTLTKLSDDRLEFRYGGPPGLLIRTSGALAAADATYHQIVIRRRNKVVKVFWDGEEAPLVVDPPDPINLLAPSEEPMVFGARGDGSEPLDADLAEVAIWTRALSNSEVAFDYDEGGSVEIPGTPTNGPGERFNFVWDVIRDLPEGEFEDVFVRVTVSTNPTTSVIVGPLTLSTATITEEDNLARNLQRRALAERVERDFLGCGLTIPFRRASRDFENSCGVELIRSTVRQILGTRAAVGAYPGDLEWRPDFGSKLWVLRHRNNDTGLREVAAAYVHEALQQEPRVSVTSIQPRTSPSDPNTLEIAVRYEIIQENVAGNRVVLPEFEEVITI